MAVQFSVCGAPLDDWVMVVMLMSYSRYFIIIIINTLFEIGKKFT